MNWTELHAQLSAAAFEKILGHPTEGSMAFIRCLPPEVVEQMAVDANFAPSGWQVFRVTNESKPEIRTITADQAVELREAKQAPILLLVDTEKAGAGMDGIYSAAQEIDESRFFKQAHQLAAKAIAEHRSPALREDAELAIKRARGHGGRRSISPWLQFDYLVSVAAGQNHPGELLYMLGLWPVKPDEQVSMREALATSRLFVERLLGNSTAGLSPTQRIRALELLNPTQAQINKLERFLRRAATRPLLDALAELAQHPELWVNALRVKRDAESVQEIVLIPWRTKGGRIAKWSGLVANGNDPTNPPLFIMDPHATNSRDYSKLEVRWQVQPSTLPKGAVQYQVQLVTDMEEELASKEVTHSAQKHEKCSFTNDDFALLDEDALIAAKVVISVVGNDDVEPVESEEIIIKFGEPPAYAPSSTAMKVRTLVEGAIELDSREDVTEVVASGAGLSEDSNGFVVLRTLSARKSYKVFRPPLIRQIEEAWAEEAKGIGRWSIRVRLSGECAGPPEFIPLDSSLASAGREELWERAETASRRMAELFAASGGVAQIYDDRSPTFNITKEYILAWAALLEEGDPLLTLANTVEVRSLSGKTIGLIVLPSHPLRVAWHAAYDNLVLYTAFETNASPKAIRDGFRLLDGSMFPAFLPCPGGKNCFVFADMLGFHVVGMVPDTDKEPKAAISLLAKAIGGTKSDDAEPILGQQSAAVLGKEIRKYIESHPTSHLLHIHALRPGDGLTVARALGYARKASTQHAEPEADEGDGPQLSFVLELYPSERQRGLAGQFIAEIREKRRRGAGVIAEQDRWMLDSFMLPGGINRPLLRWARKENHSPQKPAHIAIAFDTFDSKVALHPSSPMSSRPLFAYGLLSFFERTYIGNPFPRWHSMAPVPTVGEKHPADRVHTDRLIRMQNAIEKAVARHLGDGSGIPALYTEIAAERAEELSRIHQLCDWVITLDRNAGIEYFDSPRDNRTIYDAYVIDVVPEREDLGCLQLITSTSNLEEVQHLVSSALDQMGLSHSRKNAEFLLENLKALSGRLAIRLTGQNVPTSELIALALGHANCRIAGPEDPCWVSLKDGFLIPIDDVLDLIPPLASKANKRDPDTDGEKGFRYARPDLIYVTLGVRGRLTFQFIEVKYRRHLRTARTPDLLHTIDQQVHALRRNWDAWYTNDEMAAPFQSVRRAKLARILRFYADKAYRHHLSEERYQLLIAEIDRMVERGANYSFARPYGPDRGWVFCPEYRGATPLTITPPGWETEIFLFGPAQLSELFIYDDVSPGRQAGNMDVPTGSSVIQGTADMAAQVIHRHSETWTRQSQNEGEKNFRPDALPDRVDQAKDKQTPSAPSTITPPAVVLGHDLFTQEAVHWHLTVRGNPHLLVAGLPGMGKTTSLLNLCIQMLDQGILPIIFSYHQDIDLQLEQHLGSVRYLDYQGLGFNPLHVYDRQSVRPHLDVAGALRDIFAAIYPELGDVQGERIRNAIKESFIELGWGDPAANLKTLREPPFKRFLEILRSDPKPDRSLKTLLARLTELDDYGFFDTPNTAQSLWEGDRPTVVRIHRTQNERLQLAFASLTFYGLYKDMFRRGPQSRITHCIIFDEAHRAARLQLLPTMAKECRKYGISLVVASQEARDFHPSLFSAIANYLVLRLTDLDARFLVRNVASSDQEKMLIDKIKQLDRFHAFYFREGKRKPSYIALKNI